MAAKTDARSARDVWNASKDAPAPEPASEPDLVSEPDLTPEVNAEQAARAVLAEFLRTDVTGWKHTTTDDGHVQLFTPTDHPGRRYLVHGQCFAGSGSDPESIQQAVRWLR